MTQLETHYGGWRPSLPNQNRVTADTSGITVLPEVVYNQLQLGSCTANATAAYFRYDGMLDGHDPGDLSRLWVYGMPLILAVPILFYLWFFDSNRKH